MNFQMFQLDLEKAKEPEIKLPTSNGSLKKHESFKKHLLLIYWLCQSCILSPGLFNLYAEYILRNAGLDEAQAGIKIAGRNINNLRYTDDTTLMAENKELKRLLMKVKDESEKVGLKRNIQKTKIMASGLIISWQTDGVTMETVTGFIFLGSKNHCRWWL